MYDFDNMCEMFHGALKSILIALQDGNENKAIDTCTNAMKSVDRLHKREILRRSLDDSNKV